MDLLIGEERAPAGEDEVIKELAALQVAIMTRTDPARRGQHPKHHGCVEAAFVVHGDIPDLYRVGLFKTPGTYQALVRLSNGAAADDTTPDVHGMAVKVLGVEGPKALEGTDRQEQDFVLIDNDVFFTPDARTMLDFMKARVASAAKPAVLAEFVQNNPAIAGLLAGAKKTISSPLATQYSSTVLFKLGDGAVKYVATPDAGNRPARIEPPSAHYLRQTMAGQLAPGSMRAEFTLSVIPQTDPATNPIEDPTVRWNATPIPVATISIEPQTFDTAERNKQCEEMSFDPWHALVEHRPLGGINRARKAVYAASLSLRRSAVPVAQ